MHVIELTPIFNAILSLLIIISGVFLIVQHYPYWRKYRDRENLHWIAAATLALLLAICAALTYIFPDLLDKDFMSMLIVLRKLLTIVVLIYFLIIGYREYILKK
jgi:drug/metabolite transporter (DMT)-like permease